MPLDKQRLPLQGVKVIELSHIVAGPSAGMMLGDLGAEARDVDLAVETLAPLADAVDDGLDALRPEAVDDRLARRRLHVAAQHLLSLVQDFSRFASEAHHHVAELAHGAVGEHLLDVVLHERESGGDEDRDAADDADDIAYWTALHRELSRKELPGH